MRENLATAVAVACQKVFDLSVPIELSRPDEQFGDFATNIALQLSKQLGKNPREIAELLAVELRQNEVIVSVEIAGPGFLNLKLTDEALVSLADKKPAMTYQGQEILVEFGDPNPFKEMHLGHLYTAIVGDSISSMLEAAGANVKRLSYHGDVGMHVAKAIWALKQALAEEYNDPSADRLDDEKVSDKLKSALGVYYAKGAAAYDEDKQAEAEIRQINEQVYNQDDPVINKIHAWGSQQSFGYFDQIFNELGIRYEPNGRYLESVTTKVGTDFVRQHTGSVFEESEGAVVYKGEKVGLHTRVFINSKGLPTYEAKDLGLAELKNQDYPEATQSIIITANEQTEYFKVMLAALNEFDPKLSAKTKHIAHGFLSLTSGKMSSRSGKVYSASNLMDSVREAASSAYPNSDVQTAVYLAAMKYTFLKNRIGGDIIFDVNESVSLEGNSGPYIQYAHARAKSILNKSTVQVGELSDLDDAERSLLRKIGEYAEVIDRAVADLMPHYICNYLYELAQTFNRFYEHNRVIGDSREAVRLKLVSSYADTLRSGLQLLNIAAPDKM